eukprot:10939668-Alexandrium_andersonii.AAC.1
MVDSDWAGQRSGQRSVSAGIAVLQDCLMAGWSRTQRQVAQHSAQAELYAIVEGCSEGSARSTSWARSASRWRSASSATARRAGRRASAWAQGGRG